jgi:hypothetical protein
VVALRFIDSFDHYTTADITEKWTANRNCTVSAGNGRRGTACVRCTYDQWLTKTLDNQSTWNVGLAWRYTNMPGGSTRICLLQDAGTTQLDLRWNSGGTLSVTRNGAVLGTSTAVVPAESYAYLEFRGVIHASLGSYQVRLHGATVLEGSAVNTQVTGNAFANMVLMGHFFDSNLGTVDIDDVYICDGQGTVHTTLLGECRVDALLPTGDGSHSAWTPSTGTTHSTLVDEPAPNDDTDYLSTATAAARESHALANLPSMPTPLIYGVQHSLSARKDDAGTRQVKSLLHSGATTQAGAQTFTLASTYTYYSELWPVDPATGTAWTVAGINALEAGAEAV